MPRGAGFVVVVSLALCAPAAASPYDAALARAGSLAQTKDHAGAALVLLGVVGDYGDDYNLNLEIAWQSFQATDYLAAQTYYRRALSISGGAYVAKLGLAWTRLRLGDRNGARAMFATLVDERPLDKSAQLGAMMAASAAKPAVHWSASAYGTWHAYRELGDESSAVGLTAAVGVSLPDVAFGAVTYRYLTYSLLAMGRGMRSGTSYMQHELYVAAGLARSHLGVAGHYGVVYDTANRGASAQAFGASARLSVWGHALGELSLTRHPDASVWRGAVSWASPSRRGVRVRPRAALQHVDGRDVMASGGVEVSYTGDRGGVSMGAELGRQWRPTYLFEPGIYGFDEDIERVAWASVSLRLSGRWVVIGSYQHIELAPLAGLAAPRAQLTTIGLAIR